MHLFVRSCGADNIFIVLINLQERYLIVGRFLFTSPLACTQLIAPRSLFEMELDGYLLHYETGIRVISIFVALASLSPWFMRL